MAELRDTMFRFARLLLVPFGAALPVAAQSGPTADDAAGLAACAICSGVMLVIPILVMIVSIIIGVWMYRDAQSRGDQQAVLWAVIGILFNLLGLVIYLIARPKTPPGAMPPSPPPAV